MFLNWGNQKTDVRHIKGAHTHIAFCSTNDRIAQDWLNRRDTKNNREKRVIKCTKQKDDQSKLPVPVKSCVSRINVPVSVQCVEREFFI